MTTSLTPSTLRSALFVDFDNVYIGLRDIDPDAAQEFATNPGQWLKWLQDGMSLAHVMPDHGLSRRNVLIRRVYLNPRSFAHFRPYFVRSSFAVTDCPPLTSQGKTATDIHMVIDILDALQHATRFDEFIILSGDADFGPVLMRLRSHDRRTVVFAAGPAAHAYRAACDALISEDRFIESALGLAAAQTAPPPEPLAAGSEPSHGKLLGRIAEAVRKAAAASGIVRAETLPTIYGTFLEFRQSTDWLGYWGLRPMTEAIIAGGSDMRLVDSDETWYLEWQPAMDAAVSVPLAAPAPDAIDRRDEVLGVVRRLVDRSSAAVPLASAATSAIQYDGRLASSEWLGFGSFSGLLLSVPRDLRGFEVVTNPQPGFVWDPRRHEPPAGAPAEVSQPEHRHPELEELVNRLNRLTGAPNLSREQYEVLFQAISDAVGAAPFHLTTTSKAVRDLCIERGKPIARSNVSFVLKGLSYTASTRLGEDVLADAPDALAEQYFDNVIHLAEESGMVLSEAEVQHMREWLGVASTG